MSEANFSAANFNFDEFRNRFAGFMQARGQVQEADAKVHAFVAGMAHSLCLLAIRCDRLEEYKVWADYSEACNERAFVNPKGKVLPVPEYKAESEANEQSEFES